MPGTAVPSPPGRRLPVPGLVALAIVAATAVGIWLQYGERLAMDTRHTAGSSSATDRIDVDASVQRVDAAGRELTLRLVVTPRGALAEEGGLSPARDLVRQTSSSIRGDLSFKAHNGSPPSTCRSP
ncbi:DUF4436 family protein [Streptomyces sp. G-G2]|uniref:DUF4436 family protein n=1 Tax=Streptomyces sp. G-G2 TaxID=3046201 RepID=UPI0032D9204B